MIFSARMARRAVPSVNYHVWQPCNMRCKFCFATFQGVRQDILPAGHLDREGSLRIVNELAEAGFEKINFAGGEPFLCPWLEELVQRAKSLGMTTSVVTNGSYFDRVDVTGLLFDLDWLVLSVDSVDPSTLRSIGRLVARQPISAERYLDICARVTAANVRLKINTVVTSANCAEDLTEFIRLAEPDRWKIMQVLPLDGPDSRRADDLVVTRKRFKGYVKRNSVAKKFGVKVVSEANKTMLGGYAMVDPAGRFFDNVTGQYHYSAPILDVGVAGALSEVKISRRAFFARDGLYDFTGGRTRRGRSVAAVLRLAAVLLIAVSSSKAPLSRR